MQIRYALVVALWGLASLTWAGTASTQVEIRAMAGNDTQRSDSAPVQDTLTYSNAGGTGTAYANLQTGILRDYAVAPPLPSNDFSYTLASSRISDIITFNAGATGTAYLEWSVDGTLAAFDNNLTSTAGLSLFISGAANNIDENHAYTNFSCAPYNVTTCQAGTSFSQTGMVAFNIAGGDPTSIEVVLDSYPADGSIGDFSNTGKVYLVLPDGVTFTSGSGVFLDEAAPVVAVPEPSTLALVVAGFGLLLWNGRRRT